jgi:tryptophan synthase alpha chain
MSRISKVFSGGRKALIVYLTAGYPASGIDEELALEAIDSGADILELGFPFSDPVADGPLIQKASEKALENGMTLPGTIELADRIRKRRENPILLMGYANPVHRMGYGTFAERLARSDADGAIIPDLPIDTAGPLRKAMRANGLALIPMAAPNTPPERLQEIVNNGDGFLYLVSMAGLTGDKIKEKAPWKKIAVQARDMGRLPVCIGFGIRTARDAARAILFSDGVVVGTAITACINDAKSTAEAKKGIRELVKDLAEAIK